MVKLTNRLKREIRNDCRHLDLRFLPDGTVESRCGEHGAYRVMFTPDQTAEKIQEISNILKYGK